MRPGRMCWLRWVGADGPVSMYAQFASGTIRDVAQRGMDTGSLVVDGIIFDEVWYLADIESETDKSCKNDWEGS